MTPGDEQKVFHTFGLIWEFLSSDVEIPASITWEQCVVKPFQTATAKKLPIPSAIVVTSERIGTNLWVVPICGSTHTHTVHPSRWIRSTITTATLATSHRHQMSHTSNASHRPGDQSGNKHIVWTKRRTRGWRKSASKERECRNPSPRLNDPGNRSSIFSCHRYQTRNPTSPQTCRPKRVPQTNCANEETEEGLSKERE